MNTNLAKLQPYPKYKDTKLEWLGNIPEEWEVKRGKTIFNCIDTRSLTGKEELLTVSSKNGVIPRKSTTVTMFKADSYIGYKMCWPNDLVINSLWAWAGGLGVANNHGIISSAYGVYRLKETANTSSNFIHELVRSTPFHWELKVRSKGIWTSRLQLTDESFLDSPFPIPPLDHQLHIVNYLNYFSSRIQKYISAKQKLVKLLEEQKQAIVHQAVTGAINVQTGKPYSKYRESNVELLSMVPSYWEVARIKFVTQVNPTTRSVHLDEHEKVEFVPMENVDEKAGIISNYELRPFNEVSRGYTTFMHGDIIFAKITPCMENGNCAIVGDLRFGVAFGSTEFIVFRPKQNKVTTKFLHLVLRNKYLRSICEVNMKGSAGQKRISPDFLSCYKIAYPGLEDQEKIVEFVEQSVSTVNRTIVRAKKEIELLQEYRTRLTADVVTGKIDVREVAKNLPDDIEQTINKTEGDDIDEAFNEDFNVSDADES